MCRISDCQIRLLIRNLYFWNRFISFSDCIEIVIWDTFRMLFVPILRFTRLSLLLSFLIKYLCLSKYIAMFKDSSLFSNHRNRDLEHFFYLHFSGGRGININITYVWDHSISTNFKPLFWNYFYTFWDYVEIVI